MCGIAGVIGSVSGAPQLVQRMCDVVRHRGPNDEGYALFAEPAANPLAIGGPDTPDAAFGMKAPYAPRGSITNVADGAFATALGHRRLAIVDLSPLGHQPMCSADGRYWIVFNGEIYNHLELRAELETNGYHFRSHTDTEVILAAYDHWGEGCLSRFNGMWAFALYDTKVQTLFLARDRFGVKPLYYWNSPSGFFAFASEIKQFTVLPGWQAQVNGQRAYDFLVFGLSDHTEETMFRGVNQLQAGHCARLPVIQSTDRCSPGPLQCRQWYRLTPEPFSGTRTSAHEEFLRRFSASVELRLRADVPVGSCLSGGLDSSSIVCVAHRLLAQRGAQTLQKTFSACAEVDRYDERKWVEEVIRSTKVEPHYTYPSLDRLFNEVPTITWHQDEPFGSTSIFAQWEVFGLAQKAGIKVLLDGQGSDEQLAGYHRFFGARLATLFKELRWVALAREIAAIRKLRTCGMGLLAKHTAHHLLPPLVVRIMAKLLGKYPLRPAWLDLNRLGAVPRDPFVELGARSATLLELSVSEITRSSLPMLLHWEDRNSMAHSIESRVPFLDYRLVEFVLGLPDQYKLFQGVTKRVLRDAMANILPEPIRQRSDKLGFVTPEEVWLREHAPDAFRAKLEAAIAASGGVLKPQCREILEEMISGKRRFSYLAWRLINFGEWVTRFDVSPTRRMQRQNTEVSKT